MINVIIYSHFTDEYKDEDKETLYVEYLFVV